MLDIFSVDAPGLRPTEAIGHNTWIKLTAPSHNELQEVADASTIPFWMLAAALDPDERARFEREDGWLLMIIRIPITNDDPDIDDEDYPEIPYLTRPLGILIKEQRSTDADFMVTVCSRPSPIIQDFVEGKVRHFNPENRLRFILQIFYRVSLKFLRYLREIDLQTNAIEKELHASVRNKELLRLLNQEKSLVFFTTSLRSNQLMLERLRKTEFLRHVVEDDRDLIEDIIVDNSQAIEMANIYTNILSGLMDAFASVINNNLNQVMRYLTQITIILMLPTLVASIYGMNVKLPMADKPWAFGGIMALCILVGVVGYFFVGRTRKV